MPLAPHVVLDTDPRWQSCLDELSTAPIVGLDIEYYCDSADVGGDVDTDEEDPAATAIRLIQVALPSGLAGRLRLSTWFTIQSGKRLGLTMLS